jgi:hypothetical protein
VTESAHAEHAYTEEHDVALGLVVEVDVHADHADAEEHEVALELVLDVVAHAGVEVVEGATQSTQTRKSTTSHSVTGTTLQSLGKSAGSTAQHVGEELGHHQHSTTEKVTGTTVQSLGEEHGVLLGLAVSKTQRPRDS